MNTLVKVGKNYISLGDDYKNYIRIDGVGYRITNDGENYYSVKIDEQGTLERETRNQESDIRYNSPTLELKYNTLQKGDTFEVSEGIFAEFDSCSRWDESPWDKNLLGMSFYVGKKYVDLCDPLEHSFRWDGITYRIDIQQAYEESMMYKVWESLYTYVSQEDSYDYSSSEEEN